MSTNCSNCFNGCAEIVSDQCVRYTGVDVPVLGIQTGDSLSFVEQALITFLTSTLDGTGIKPVIDPQIICELVQNYLPDCGDLTAVDLFNALIKATCDLQEQVDVIVAQLEALEGPYTVGCLTGVTSTSGTHAILQAVITKLCTLSVDFAAFVLDVETNYVKLADLCTLVDACIAAANPGPTQQYQKMVPYTVVEYYGPLSNFSASGAGLVGLGWDKVYLCNGANGTPDKRGRIAVGAIQGVPGGGALNPVVDPAFPGNPNYVLLGTSGVNTIQLSVNQIPSHSHTATVTVTDPGHKHSLIANYFAGSDARGTSISSSGSDVWNWQSGRLGTDVVDTNTTGIGVSVVNGSTGSSQTHNNIPPVLACYYIMYIP